MPAEGESAMNGGGSEHDFLKPALPSTLPDELFYPEELEASKPKGMSLEEWKARLELAALYKVFHTRGWDEEIINHITLRVPGPDDHFLINPFGLYYGEVTATNLVKVDLEGSEVDPSPYTVNRAGFVIHSAIHGAREDVKCVIHTHNTAGVAVACKEGGLSMDNFYSIFLYRKVAYHDFEGVTVRFGERERLVEHLGDKDVMILRNHGLLVTGPNVAKAFFLYYSLQRACEIQVATGQIPGPNIPISEDIAREGLAGAEAADPEGKFFWKMLAGAVRRAKLTIKDLM